MTHGLSSGGVSCDGALRCALEGPDASSLPSDRLVRSRLFGWPARADSAPTMAGEDQEMRRTAVEGSRGVRCRSFSRSRSSLIPLGAYLVGSEGSRGSSSPGRAGRRRRRVPSDRRGVRRRRHGARGLRRRRALSRAGLREPRVSRRPEGRRSRSSKNGSRRIQTVEKDCHRIAHFIGSAALERFDGNVAKTFAQARPPASPATTTGSSSERSSGSRRRPGSRESRGSSASRTASAVEASSTTSAATDSGTGS